MPDILAVPEARRGDTELLRVAHALADLLAARVRVLQQDQADGPARIADSVLDALSRPTTVACVLPVDGDDVDALPWHVVARADKPVILVPPTSHLKRNRIRRALLPLDGTAEAADAVAPIARLLDRAGVVLVVLHVFDRTTVPSFWDQRAHAQDAWSAEFLVRCGPLSNAQLEIRSGEPREQVIRAADAQDVDLIALGWSRTIAPGRAATVRQSVLLASVPVLLVPTAVCR